MALRNKAHWNESSKTERVKKGRKIWERKCVTDFASWSTRIDQEHSCRVRNSFSRSLPTKPNTEDANGAVDESIEMNAESQLMMQELITIFEELGRVNVDVRRKMEELSGFLESQESADSEGNEHQWSWLMDIFLCMCVCFFLKKNAIQTFMSFVSLCECRSVCECPFWVLERPLDNQHHSSCARLLCVCVCVCVLWGREREKLCLIQTIIINPSSFWSRVTNGLLFCFFTFD